MPSHGCFHSMRLFIAIGILRWKGRCYLVGVSGFWFGGFRLGQFYHVMGVRIDVT